MSSGDVPALVRVLDAFLADRAALGSLRSDLDTLDLAAGAAFAILGALRADVAELRADLARLAVSAALPHAMPCLADPAAMPARPTHAATAERATSQS